MANRARASKAVFYANLLKDRGIKNAKKWLIENSDQVTKRQGVGIKPIEIVKDGKSTYYMSYAEACYMIVKEKEVSL